MDIVVYTYPLLLSDDCIDHFANVSLFTMFDTNCGHWKIPVGEADLDKSRFTIHSWTYRYWKMHFGLLNGPVTFQ